MPTKPENMARQEYRPRSGAGDSSLRKVLVAAISAPMPMPERTRHPISHQMSVAVADINEPIVNNVTETIRLSLRPNRSPIRLTKKDPMM